MNFDLVLTHLLDGFSSGKTRYAVMGGFALGALGAPRATIDLDFLIHRDDMESAHDILASLGYKRIFRSENVSQYEGKDLIWGCLDFIHAFRPLGLGMLGRAIDRPIFQGTRMIRVLRPEDVIGLKVQALANEPQRKARELADIESLASVHAADMDWGRVEEFFGLFGLDRDFKDLRERFERA